MLPCVVRQKFINISTSSLFLGSYLFPQAENGVSKFLLNINTFIPEYEDFKYSQIVYMLSNYYLTS
jgi:hypothetical protein